MATIKDISELAGVSQATVSRVINGTSRVAYDKKLKVEKAIDALSYRKKVMKSPSFASGSGCIGVVVPDFSEPLYADTLKNIEDKLRECNYHVLASAGSSTENSQRRSVEFLLGRRVDALILYTPHLSDDYLISLEAQDIPVVVVNRYIPEIETSCINIDNELGGKLAAQYLLKMGHKKIACISGPLDSSEARERLQGYRTAIEEAGLNYSEALVSQARLTCESGAHAMQKLLNRKEEFSAVFACYDQLAFGALKSLQEQGYKVPEQISLIGFNNHMFTRYLASPLTTVKFPVEQMCLEAVQLILQKINNQEHDVNFNLVPALVVRDSVGAVAQNMQHVY
ncbi:LacI family DNA-binding transcriptional regulator [Vibrio marisflavi]|uniref:HTH-type transcriptional regulator GalR n=1 Tax=Vibrio marisflavi CECT 7928 TaxID=634439 RepID=A0ABM9A2C0_9VIBR|nr:substrate-binding domain-containing protein [Vibrio marisflavi]CAH0538543.1 HTH-type transcriptional regulator GalR [Vibrio marisflavi CECT 7928]